MLPMQSDSASRDVLTRGLPPRLSRALRIAADDIGISQGAVVKVALRDWLTARGYMPVGTQLEEAPTHDPLHHRADPHPRPAPRG